MVQRTLIGVGQSSHEGEFDAWLESHPEQFLEHLTRIDELLIYLNRATARTEDILEAIAAAGGIMLPGGLSSVISIPLDPEVLNRALQAMDLKGKTSYPNIKHCFACPAGMTTTFALGLPSGYYCTCCLCTISSDFYDPNMAVTVYVDGGLLTPWGFALTGPSTLCYGQYHVKKDRVDYIVANNTAFAAMVTVSIEPICLIEKAFYEEFYAPIVAHMAKSLEEVAYGKI